MPPPAAGDDELVVATVNVNGVRAAHRRGMAAWLDKRAPDALALQEVRAPAGLAAERLGDGWHVTETVCATPGRSGVAVAARGPLLSSRGGLPGFEDEGRWVEATIGTAAGPLRLVSVYVHSGEAGTARQDAKYAFLAAARDRLDDLVADPTPTLVCGDVNIGHTERDIRNWRGNRGRAGFLEQERQWLTDLYAAGWDDVGRALAGDVDGPYSWWTWRGQAFDRDTGWRIDVHVARADLARRARWAAVDRAASYAERFSDHAPVVVAYGLPPGDGEPPGADPGGQAGAVGSEPSGV